MSWNCRIVRHKHIVKHDDKEYITHWYGIHEAYYDENGLVGMITKEPRCITGDTVSDLKMGLEQQAKAFSAPILDYDNIPEPGCVMDLHDDNDNESEIDDYLTSLTPEEIEEEQRLGQEVDDFDSGQFYMDQEIERIKDEEKYNEELKNSKS